MLRFLLAAAITDVCMIAATNTVEIAPGVFMPLANMGGSDGHYSNYSLWLELGGRGLDTALSYTRGDVQPKLGEAVHKSGIPRSEIFITTKIPCCPAKSSGFQGYYCNGHEKHPQPDADIDQTLSDIGIEYADLILLHWPCGRTEDTLATYKGLERALASKKARAIGISNFNAGDIDSLLKGVSVTPAFNQCRTSVGNHDDATIAKCKAHNITYGAFSPLNKGKVLKDPDVQAVAKAHKVSAATVALRWLVQQGHTFTTASSKEEYDKDDLAAFNFELTDQEMARLTRVRQSSDMLV